MKVPHVLAIACLFLLAGFSTAIHAQESDSLEAQLIGKWVADVEKTMEHMKENADEMPEGMMEMMEMMLPQISLTFGDDDTFTMGSPQGDQTGGCKVSDVNEEKKSLKITISMEGAPEEKTGVITFSEKDAMKLETDEGDTLYFKRAPKEDADGADSKDSDG